MWSELIPTGLALGAAVAASYTDLKDRVIPNKLTYPLIGFGIIFHLALGVYRGEPARATYGAIGASIAFGMGYAMWLTSGWAGGDVKLFTALGALLPAHKAAPPYSANYPLFSLTILFNGIIVAVPILLIYAAVSRAAGRGAFYETVRISELKEGMIPAEIIYEKNGEIERHDPGRFGFLSRAWGTPERDQQLTNPDRATSISRRRAEALRKLVREGKLEDRIKVKKGTPFAPVLGAGVLIGVLYGGLYWKILTLLA